MPDLKKLTATDSLYYCLQAVKSVSGSNGRPTEAAAACDLFITSYKAGTATSHESIPVAGIILKQFFGTQAALGNGNDIETLRQAREGAAHDGFDSMQFSLALKIGTALGQMAVELTRQNP